MFRNPYAPDFFPFFSCFMVFMIIVFVADAILRGIALWRAARANQVPWFIALMVLNTMGILPIIYLSFFAEKPLYKTNSKQTTKKPARRKSR